MGVTLYQRAGRGLALTAKGRELLAFARGTRDETDASLERFSGEGAVATTVLAAGEGTLLDVLGPCSSPPAAAASLPSKRCAR